ncbi:hypothetical protein Nepgr_016473 [Nepenthes gracilis]|uniref:Uncharacterized protein n=1 Tax=Nepenthes gracilis TaxID=150966 RepID=A0AAD3SPA2_NEPGR|nr:hypothetical protein Nepgr_016473 [Nepenthes gracilis]
MLLVLRPVDAEKQSTLMWSWAVMLMLMVFISLHFVCHLYGPAGLPLSLRVQMLERYSVSCDIVSSPTEGWCRCYRCIQEEWRVAVLHTMVASIDRVPYSPFSSYWNLLRCCLSRFSVACGWFGPSCSMCRCCRMLSSWRTRRGVVSVLDLRLMPKMVAFGMLYMIVATARDSDPMPAAADAGSKDVHSVDDGSSHCSLEAPDGAHHVLDNSSCALDQIDGSPVGAPSVSMVMPLRSLHSGWIGEILQWMEFKVCPSMKIPGNIPSLGDGENLCPRKFRLLILESLLALALELSLD